MCKRGPLNICHNTLGLKCQDIFENSKGKKLSSVLVQQFQIEICKTKYVKQVVLKVLKKVYFYQKENL